MPTKKFQEIRSFLQSYQSEATEKVENKEFQDAEIDAILLQAIITTNPDIEALNRIIGNYCHCPFSHEISTTSLENRIDELHWHGIYTVNQLINCIKNNKRTAVIIAEEFLRNNTTNEDSPKIPISKTIALYYICFAEVVRRNLDYDQAMQYFEDSYIFSGAERKDAVHFLLQLSKKINNQS